MLALSIILRVWYAHKCLHIHTHTCDVKCQVLQINSYLVGDTRGDGKPSKRVCTWYTVKALSEICLEEFKLSANSRRIVSAVPSCLWLCFTRSQCVYRGTNLTQHNYPHMHHTYTHAHIKYTYMHAYIHQTQAHIPTHLPVCRANIVKFSEQQQVSWDPLHRCNQQALCEHGSHHLNKRDASVWKEHAEHSLEETVLAACSCR